MKWANFGMNLHEAANKSENDMNNLVDEWL